jgi:5-methylcytosine-specific restriction protein B
MSGLRYPYSKDSFELPENLYIVGTMNTADRSIALVDFALRRRFHFVAFAADSNILRRWLSRENPSMLEVADYLSYVNNQIVGDDFAIGFSYFMRSDLDETTLERIWQGSVLPALAEYYYNDPERLSLFNLAKVQENVHQLTESLVHDHNIVEPPSLDSP